MKMDFDIGNMFYIILTLIIIIAGAFGKKKKPVHSPAASETPENPLVVGNILEKKNKRVFCK